MTTAVSGGQDLVLALDAVEIASVVETAAMTKPTSKVMSPNVRIALADEPGVLRLVRRTARSR